MEIEQIIKQIQERVYRQTGKYLKSVQVEILQGVLQDLKYRTIANRTKREENSIKKEASLLWKQLGDVFGEKVTKPYLKQVLERQFSSQSVVSNSSNQQSDCYQDWADSPDVGYFLGRETDLNTLKEWIIRDRCRLIAVVGLPGKGKTSLTVKLAQEITGEFQGVIWRSLLNSLSIQDLIKDWILFLSHQEKTDLPDSLEQQICLLISYLKQNRYLFILDNVESIITAGTQGLKYKSGYENYHQLLEKIAEVSHQSCFLLTSRIKIRHLEKFAGQHQPVRFFQLGGLTVDPAKQLVEQKGEFFATETEWEQLINLYRGNPLALKLTACHIQNVFGGNIGEFLKNNSLFFQDIRELLDWHFQSSIPEENQILYWLAIHREPVSLLELKTHLVSPLSQHHLSDYLDCLQGRMLLEKTADQHRFTLQPVLMEYVTEKLIATVTQELFVGEFNLFNRYALMLATTKDYIKTSQIRTIIHPIIEALLAQFQTVSYLETHLKSLIRQTQEKSPLTPGYIGGNLINLLCTLEINLTGYDFSNLTIWQANLQGIKLHYVDFSNCHFKNTVFTQCFGGIHALAFTPDGQILAAGDSEGMIRFLNVETGEILTTFGKHKWWVASLAFSSDGQKLVSSSLDHTVKVWHGKTGQLLHSLEGHNEWVWTATFSPDGQIIASGSNDQTIKVWDANNGQLLKTLKGHQAWVLSVAFSPDQAILASGSYDKTIKLWDVKTGECLQTITGSNDAIWCVAFSPDGRQLASCGYEKIIRIWEIETGKCDQILQGHKKEIKVLAWSPDGQTIASGCFDSIVKFWSVKTGSCRASLKQYKTGIRTLAFSPDNQTVATGDNDQIIKLWNRQNGKCLQTFRGYTNWVWSLALSPDGQMLASSHLDHQVRLWNSETGDCLNTLTGHHAWVWSVAFSPDGKTVASSSDDETIRLWDVNTGNCWKCLNYSTEYYQGGIWTIAFSSDGFYLASGGQDTTVKVWNLQTDKLTVLTGHQGWVWRLAFHPKAAILASASDDKTIKVWDVKTQECLHTFPEKNNIRSIAFNFEGSLLASGSEEKTVKVWDLKTEKCLHTLFGHEGWIWSVDFSPDGQILASGGDDCTVKLWEMKTGNCLHTLAEHDSTVTSVMFNRYRHKMMSASSDGQIKQWEVETGKCLKSLIVPNIYHQMKIGNVQGLIEAQKEALKGLGAVDKSGF
jgi:WD40 repeat protein